MNKIYTIIFLLAVVVTGGLFMLSKGTGNVPVPVESKSPGAGIQGRVIFGVTDTAVSMQNVQSVMLTVDKVEVQGAGQGWLTVSTQEKQFDLLLLKSSNATAVLADAKVAAGTYNQIRLHVKKLTVTMAGKVYDATLPSDNLKIDGKLQVQADSTSSTVLDFLADKSLHVTGKGTYIFTPVVHLETRSNAEVTTTNDGFMTAYGGIQDANITVGTDEKGETHENFMLDAKADLEINNGMIHIVGGTDLKMSVSTIVSLNAQNNLGISGTATLTDENGKVRVVLDLNGAPLVIPEPAHIHTGFCANIGGVKYSLSSAVNGHSETVINTTLAKLKLEMPLAINVHKSVIESGVYVACANLVIN